MLKTARLLLCIVLLYYATIAVKKCNCRLYAHRNAFQPVAHAEI